MLLAAGVAVSLALLVGPVSWRVALQTRCGDLLAPALDWGRSVTEEVVSRTRPDSATIERLTAERDAWKRVGRQLELRLVEQQATLARLEKESARPLAEAGDPLLETQVITGRVIGASQSLTGEAAGLLVDAGRAAGIRGAELVLDSGDDTALIDQGADAGVAADELVLAGRSVVGRIATVGEWTSRVQPVTDPHFRGYAQLVRRSAVGPVFGAKGILEGTGRACRLSFVSATEPVAVGDAVYTVPTHVPTSRPLYYGRVTAVKLEESADYWTVEVSPDVTEIPDRVQVLQVELSSVRVPPEVAE